MTILIIHQFTQGKFKETEAFCFRLPVFQHLVRVASWEVAEISSPRHQYPIFVLGNELVYNWRDIVVSEGDIDLSYWLSYFQGETYAIHTLGLKFATHGITLPRKRKVSGSFRTTRIFRTLLRTSGEPPESIGTNKD